MSGLVWSRPLSLCLGLGECLALDKAVFEEGLQMLVYYRLSCHATDKASEKLLSPGRTTHRRTLTGKINVYRRNSPFDSAVPSDSGAVRVLPFLGRGSCLHVSFLTACFMLYISPDKHMITVPSLSDPTAVSQRNIVSLNKL